MPQVKGHSGLNIDFVDHLTKGKPTAGEGKHFAIAPITIMQLGFLVYNIPNVSAHNCGAKASP